MPEGPLSPKDLGKYFAMAQVGIEMVVPIAIGMAVDSYLGWAPWGVVVGMVLGFGGGLFHLITLANRLNEPKRPPTSQKGGEGAGAVQEKRDVQ